MFPARGLATAEIEKVPDTRTSNSCCNDEVDFAHHLYAVLVLSLLFGHKRCTAIYQFMDIEGRVGHIFFNDIPYHFYGMLSRLREQQE